MIDLRDLGRRVVTLSFRYYVDATMEKAGVKFKILDAAGKELFVLKEPFWGRTEDWTEFEMPLPQSARDPFIRLEWLLATGRRRGERRRLSSSMMS